MARQDSSVSICRLGGYIVVRYACVRAPHWYFCHTTADICVVARGFFPVPLNRCSFEILLADSLDVAGPLADGCRRRTRDEPGPLREHCLADHHHDDNCRLWRSVHSNLRYDDRDGGNELLSGGH